MMIAFLWNATQNYEDYPKGEDMKSMISTMACILTLLECTTINDANEAMYMCLSDKIKIEP